MYRQQRQLVRILHTPLNVLPKNWSIPLVGVRERERERERERLASQRVDCHTAVPPASRFVTRIALYIHLYWPARVTEQLILSAT